MQTLIPLQGFCQRGDLKMYERTRVSFGRVCRN